MKLKERLRIAWQVLTKGTCKEFDREFQRKRLSLTYNFEATYYPEDELWVNEVDRMACKYFAEQIFQSRAVSVDVKYRYDKPTPIRRFYQIDVLMPEK